MKRKKSTRTIIALVTLGILVWILFGFILWNIYSSITRSETERPFQDGLPEQEIVFMPYDPFYFHGTTRKTIGVVNADGSQRELFRFWISGGSAINRPRHFSTYANEPKWSMNGDSLAFYIRDTAPTLRIVDDQGYMHGKECIKFSIQDFGFDGRGNIIAWISRRDIYFEDYDIEVGEDEKLLIIYDLEACQIIDLFTIPIADSYWNISGLSISKEGLLTCTIEESVEFADQQSIRQYSIFIYDLETEESQTIPGLYPSLSDDGSLLAYYGYSGDIRIRDMSSNDDRFLKWVHEIGDFYEFVSRPGWSPDNQWLVYNTYDGKIYKIDVITGEETYLTEGYTPDWK